jgi:Uma2 family endonuclease
MQERTKHPDPPWEARLTIEEFLEMLEERPDGEHWELIEGVAIMNPSPIDWHQQIVANVIRHLLNTKDARAAPWFVMPGISTRVPASPGSLPRPDVFVKENPLTGNHTTDDALIMFEVLSKSNRKPNQAWRRRVYSSIPNCQHYVTISLKGAEAVRYDRADKWTGATMTGLDALLALPAIDLTVPLRDIYKWTPIE